MPHAPLALQGFLPAWDIERRRADLSSILAWTLDAIRREGVPLDHLDRLHHHLDPPAARALAQRLSAGSLAPEIRAHVRALVRRVLPEIPHARVSLQTHAHFRILLPGDHGAPVPPHTDFGFGHALGERNLWIALTDADGSAALHLLPLADSLAWIARAARLHGVLHDTPLIPPVPTRAGDVLLFTPLHLHRAHPPAGDHTRVSIDLRLLPRPHTSGDLSFSPLGDDA